MGNVEIKIGNCPKKIDFGAGVARNKQKSHKGSNLQEASQGRVVRATTDDSLTEIFGRIKHTKTPVVIKYGASWCGICNQMLPAFCRLSNDFPSLSFVYADVDECPEATKHIRYTPTFHFYRDGERVDEMFGAGEERLHDRLWLHS